MKRVAIVVLCVCMVMAAVSAKACNDAACFTSGETVSDLIALREAPDVNAPVRCSLYAGVGMDVVGHEEGWLAVRLRGVPVPGGPLPEEGVFGSYNEQATIHGYVREQDVIEVSWVALSSCYALLPEARVNVPAGTLISLLEAPGADADLRAVVLPGEEMRVLGRVDGYYLLFTQGAYGYLPEDAVETNGVSAALPADTLMPSPHVYDDVPLTFAIIDPPQADERVALLDAPDADAEQIMTLACGDVVQVLEEGDPYVFARTAEAEGYLPMDRLRIDGRPGRTILYSIAYMRVMFSLDTVEVYAFPDAGSELVRDVDTYNVSVLDVAGSWMYVRTVDMGVWEEDQSDRVVMGFMRPDDRVTLGSGLTKEPPAYAIVMLPEDLPRVPLYGIADGEADRSTVLGQYYHAAQMEVLAWPDGEDDNEEACALVRVDGREGFVEVRYLRQIATGAPAVW